MTEIAITDGGDSLEVSDSTVAITITDDGDALEVSEERTDLTVDGATQLVSVLEGTFVERWPYIVGSPDSFRTDLEFIENSSSAGVIDGCQPTDNGDGTLSMGAGIALLRGSASRRGDLYSVQVEEQLDIALTDNAVNYVYLDFNGGDPTFIASTSPTSWNGIDKAIAIVAYREGNDLQLVDLERQNLDMDARILDYLFDVQRFARVGNGSLLFSSGLNIGVTEGSFYFILREIPHPEFDTSGADVFEAAHRDGGGGWTYVPNQSQIDVERYDNGSGALTNLSNNRWGVHWVYLILADTPSLFVVYGQAQYLNQSQALAATIPNELPGKVAALGELVGRVIFQEGDTELAVESAFQTQFGFTVPVSHNGLSGLQGGQFGERYHLTENEYQRLRGPSANVSSTIYTVALSDGKVIVDDDSAGANVTITLPPAATAGDGFEVVILKKGSSHIVTIDGDGAETINGEPSFDLRLQYESIKLLADGSEWFIIEA